MVEGIWASCRSTGHQCLQLDFSSSVLISSDEGGGQWIEGEVVCLCFVLLQLRVSGISGNVQFDDRGERRNYKIDIVSLKRVSVKTVIGYWNDSHGLHIFPEGGKETSDVEDQSDVFKEKPVEVVTIEVSRTVEVNQVHPS